jgi:hypothetical protein
MHRRDFVSTMLAAAGRAQKAEDLVAGIEVSTLIRYEDYGKAWAQPRACLVPGTRPKLLMTLQQITGSDVYHHVQWMESADGGRAWSRPQPIPGMGRRDLGGGLEEAYCDTVPEYHPATKCVLALAHNVYYRNNILTMPWEKRWPVYAVRQPDGQWVSPKKLEWNDPGATGMYSSNCSQRITVENGALIVPVTYGPLGRPDHGVTTLACRFDGERLTVVERGNELRLPVQRGLLEPSLARRGKGQFWMTIRAEDGRGYVTTARDGLHWEPIQPWRWEDGTPLDMSSTQQHWLVHSESLHLAYTRKAPGNESVVRWRAPLFMARVDEGNKALLRETERIVFPQRGTGGEKGLDAWLSGNFHPAILNEHESVVTDGQVNPARGYVGDVLLARIRWKRPNRL